MAPSEYALLQEQIKGLTTLVNAQFSGVNERLDKINGKVQKHEDQINEALRERGANRQKQEDYFSEIDTLSKQVNELEKMEVTHILNCPISPKLRAIEDNLLTQTTIKKYMGVMFTGGVALGGLIVAIIKLFMN